MLILILHYSSIVVSVYIPTNFVMNMLILSQMIEKAYCLLLSHVNNFIRYRSMHEGLNSTQ